MIDWRGWIKFGPMAERWRFEEDLLLVETYGPSADSSLGLPTGEYGSVMVHAVITVPGDEVVFYLVSAPSVAEVRQVFAGVGVDSMRIVPAVWTSESRRIEQ